ncbi:hypothetical protein CSUI_005612 [Cystoisospora suis]|uniref:Uncharacterized protein n=1 Tax=Cystoisospora suis TaxID=483139 RepID=A0A2C6KWZ4_9APIC|nr:hypothetical protein CSUI_005612 [Cystoisospora suis]
MLMPPHSLSQISLYPSWVSEERMGKTNRGFSRPGNKSASPKEPTRLFVLPGELSCSMDRSLGFLVL